MPSSSFVLGSGATFVSLLSLAVASPLTFVGTTTQEAAWDPWASSTTSSKPKVPATSTWSEWDPAVTTRSTTSSKATVSSWSEWDPAVTTRSTTSSKASESAWGNWNGVSSVTGTTKVGCPIGYSTYTTKPCWTVDNKQTCTEIIKTTQFNACTTTTSSKPSVPTTKSSATDYNWNNWSTTKPNTATYTTSAGNGGWNNWNGNDNGNSVRTTCGGVMTTTLSSCVTPAPTSVTSCSTYHLEVAPYAATSSCTTYAAKESVGPVCALYVAALSYKCETTSTCSTPEAAKSTICSLKSTSTTSKSAAGSSSTWADWASTTTSKSADPITSTWADWSSTTSKAADSDKYTTSCTTYHLEKAPYTPTSSCSTYLKSTSAVPNMVNPFVTECTTITAKVTPVCSAVTKTNVITSTITAVTTSKTSTSTVVCSTPAVSVVTNCKTINTFTAPAAQSTCYPTSSCSTYHLEVAPYAATSTCSTITACAAVAVPTGYVGMPNPFTTKCDTTTVTPAAVCSTVWGQWDSNKGTTTSKTPDAATGTAWSSWAGQPTGVQGVKSYTGAATSVEAGALVMVAAAIIGGAAMIL